MHAKTILAIIPISQRMAPTNLPWGPPLTYPIVKNILAIIMTKPNDAWTIGWYNPPIAIRAMAVGKCSRKFKWALWALLNLYLN